MHKTLLLGLITVLNIFPVLSSDLINPIRPFIIAELNKVGLGKKLFLKGLFMFHIHHR